MSFVVDYAMPKENRRLFLGIVSLSEHYDTPGPASPIIYRAILQPPIGLFGTCR